MAPAPTRPSTISTTPVQRRAKDHPAEADPVEKAHQGHSAKATAQEIALVVLAGTVVVTAPLAFITVRRWWRWWTE